MAGLSGKLRMLVANGTNLVVITGSMISAIDDMKHECQRQFELCYVLHGAKQNKTYDSSKGSCSCCSWYKAVFGRSLNTLQYNAPDTTLLWQ
eukprot:m.168605 g.168605  ORF g.168605 m.168605 type:complete len:92 (-) comp14480_c0_seq2:79-354(-)